MIKYLTKWENVEETKRQIIPVFAKWQKENLKITHGDYQRTNNLISTMELTYGLAYTDTSDYAELGNTNVQAEKYNRALKQFMFFRSLRLDSEGNLYAIFYLADSVTEIYEVIGNIKEK